METTSTLIIGGGISGLACARRLHDAGHPFLLVTDRLGGRMYHSPDGSMNFGATYINEDYHHVSRYVGRGIPFRLREAHRLDSSGLDSLFAWQNLRHGRSAVRLVLRLRALRQELQRFRRDAEHTPNAVLLHHYPLIARYTRQPAGELIDELRLRPLHDRYFTLAFQATCFTDPFGVNAFFYLVTLFPVILRVWMADFTHTYDRLTAGYQDRIHTGYVKTLDRVANGQWRVGTAEGQTYMARNVVIAAPYHNARSFYPVPRPYLSPAATILSVRGERQRACDGKRFIVSPSEETGLTLIWRQQSGEDMLFSTRVRPDLTAVYRTAQVTAAVTWKTAVVISNAEWAPLRLEDGLYLAGDYNLCGLEDSFITGLCAANQILKQASAGGQVA